MNMMQKRKVCVISVDGRHISLNLIGRMLFGILLLKLSPPLLLLIIMIKVMGMTQQQRRQQLLNNDVLGRDDQVGISNVVPWHGNISDQP
jgi:hypothetical protein